VQITDAINEFEGSGLWHEEDGFYYDAIRRTGGAAHPLKGAPSLCRGSGGRSGLIVAQGLHYLVGRDPQQGNCTHACMHACISPYCLAHIWRPIASWAHLPPGPPVAGFYPSQFYPSPCNTIQAHASLSMSTRNSIQALPSPSRQAVPCIIARFRTIPALILLLSSRCVIYQVRSMVGLTPLFAVLVIEPETLQKLPGFAKRMQWFLDNRPDLAAQVCVICIQ